MKADAKVFKGIEYVQVNELPQTQRELINRTIDPELFIKILVDGKIVSGCLQYKDYCNWYQHQYAASATVSDKVASPVEINKNLAYNKL
jgi:hypothetical protein